MLPRLSTKVHPSSSNSTAVDYACLPSPSAPPVEAELPKSTGGQNERDCTRWLYNYPRLSFVLLFVLCTYIGGIFVSTKVTAWTLSVLGVDGELANARQVYLASSQRLKSMTECVDRSSLEYLAAAKLHYEVDSKRVQKIIDANDDALSNQRNATMTCSAAFLSSLKEQVQISASDDANSTLSCFSDRFYENAPDTNALSSSRALVLAVRALLTTQAVTAANDSVSKQQIQFENQLVDMWKSVDSVKTSIDKTLSATNTLTSEQLSSLAPILSDKDGEGHTKQSASRLDRLSKVVSSELSDPLASTSSTSLEAIRKAGRTLHKALEFLSGLHEGLSDVMDTVDGTWQLLEKQLNATAQQAVQLQKELAYAAESTAQQINRTTSAILTSFGQAQQEIATSFDILHQHWQDAVSKLVAQGFTPWHRLGDRLVAELTANQRQSVRPENSIQRKYILPDRTTNSSLETERARLAATAARYEDPQASNSSASADHGEEFDIDTAVLRASLVDIGAFVTQVIFYVDAGRLTLMVADLAVGLISESYSDMPMLDIRGISAADTIGSVCEVFLCKHSVWTVCCVIVANASELTRVLVRFVLLLAAASVVTAGLFRWKQDHIEHCGGAALPSNASPTVIQSITRAYFENKGNASNSVVDPLDEIERYTTIINDSIRNDYAALELDSAAVWMNQSAALNDFGDCATTTSTLVRMLQDCSQQVSINDASLSSRCLTSELRNTSGLVTPSKTATQLSENAPYLAPSNAFESCFPEEAAGRTAIVNKLQHDLACATEEAVYLSCASWWVLVVIFVANRFAMRMVIKAAGVYWWRFLSADRLQFVGFCREDGDIVASNTLPLAIQQHLRDAKWQIIGRFVGIGFAFTCVVIVLIAVFQGMV